jgi:hypothetical protein
MNASTPVSVASPDNPALYDRELLEHAAGFIAAADGYCARGYVARDFILTFLLGRGMELAFKAYLIRQGAAERRLRALGHSLDRLMSACEETQFTALAGLNMDDVKVIRILDAEYAAKAFEYPERRLVAQYGIR